MGLSLHHKGNPGDAIVAYKKALSIEPNNTMSWNNIFFPLQAIKTQVASGSELTSYLPEEDGSTYNTIARAILWHKLNRSADKGDNITDDILKKLSTANNQIIKNPHNHDKLSKIDTLPPKKFVAMTHCGRSGTGLLHSLIDGHPQISTLPSIYFSEYFDHSAWEKIIAGGWNEMADRFIEIYEVLFDASSSKPIQSKSKISIKNIGHRMGMTRVGDEGNETLKVDKKMFRSELNRLMSCYDELNNAIFFELVHAAYDKSINDVNEKSQIFYHIHNPDTYAHLNFLRMVPDAQRIIMVREPIQSCESWIRNRFNEDDYNSCAVRILFMLFEINNDIYERQETIGLRLEDLKDHPKQTIAALCKWMAIEETDSLYEMTAQGKKWWGDPASPDYSKEGMNPFGKTAIKRETGIIFSDRDQFVLRTLFHPFRVRFGYIEENIEQFKVDLGKIKPMLGDMFDFEKAIIERTTGDYEKFMKSGPYMYFRSGLLERWNTLNEFGTYPTMINQLQIN